MDFFHPFNSKPNPQDGSGYTYQWLASAYIIVQLRNVLALKENSCFGDFVGRYIANPKKLEAKFGGPPEAFEDFELHCDGQPIVKFQIKSFLEATLAALSHKSVREPIKKYIDGDFKGIFVLVVSAPIQERKPRPSISQSSPVSILSLVDEKALLHSVRDRGDLGLLQNFHVWNLPCHDHMKTTLIEAFKHNSDNFHQFLSEIQTVASAINSPLVSLWELIDKLGNFASLDSDVGTWVSQINSDFLESILRETGMCEGGREAAFIRDHYVARSSDDELVNTLKEVNLDDNITECNRLLKNIRSFSANLPVISDVRKPLQDLEGLLTVFRGYLRSGISAKKIEEYSYDFREWAIGKRAELREDNHALELSRDASRLFNNVKKKCSNFRRVAVLFGSPGTGKTFSCLKLLGKTRWSYFLSGKELSVLSCGEIRSLLSKKLKLKGKNFKIDDHLYALSRRENGFLVVDGIDECPRFSIQDLRSLMLEVVSCPGTYKVILTCRSDYLDYRRVSFEKEYMKWREDTLLFADIIEVTPMSHGRLSDWLRKYCEIFSLPISLISAGWSALSRRHRPRDLQHVFKALKDLYFAHRITEPLIFPRIIQMYSQYVNEDCHSRRGRKGDLEVTITQITELAERYCECGQESVLKEQFEKRYNMEKQEAKQDLLDALCNKCGELETIILPDIGVILEWRVSDFPNFHIARKLYTSFLGCPAQKVGESISTLVATYGHRASDILHHFIYRAQCDGEFHGDGASLALKHLKEFLRSGAETGQFASFVMVVTEYERYGDLRSFPDVETSATFLKGLSPNSALDYLDTLGLYFEKSGNQDIVRQMDLYIRTANVFLEAQIGLNLFEVAQNAKDYAEKILNKAKKWVGSDGLPQDVVKVLKHIGDLRPSLKVLEDAICFWALEVVETATEFRVADAFLFQLGCLERNDRRKFLSRRLSEAVADKPMWGNALTFEANLFHAPHYYVRLELVNVFVKLWHEKGVINSGLEILASLKSSPIPEKRRNAIFVAQKLFLEKEKCRSEVFDCIKDEADLELLSTGLGILAAEGGSKEIDKLCAKRDLVEISFQLEGGLEKLKTSRLILEYCDCHRGLINFIAWFPAPEWVLTLFKDTCRNDTHPAGTPPDWIDDLDEKVDGAQELPAFQKFYRQLRNLL